MEGTKALCGTACCCKNCAVGIVLRSNSDLTKKSHAISFVIESISFPPMQLVRRNSMLQSLFPMIPFSSVLLDWLCMVTH